MKIENILNQREKQELQKFIHNKVLRDAVKKVLLYDLYYCGTLRLDDDANTKNFALDMADNQNMSPTQLGYNVKVSADGIKLIEKAYDNIDRFKEVSKEDKETKNPAI